MKKSKHAFIVLVGCILLLLFSLSCQDKKNTGISPCEANPGSCKSILEAKDFFVFKIGSYWVYEEETTHLRDSMYVTDCSNSESNYDFYVRIKSSLSDYEYRYWPTFYENVSGCSQTGSVNKKCIYINRSKGKFQDNLGDAEVFFINYKQGDVYGTVGDMNNCPDSKIVVSEILSNYTLVNQVFENVVKMYESCPRHEGYQPINVYYSKNIGIIRKELLDSNQVWNLVNYHVIQ